jgi:hypothetical protein
MMPQLTGLAVTLSTADDEDSKTDDHLYIGVVGSGGGREFQLFSSEDEDKDLNTGEIEKFAPGVIREGGFVDGATKFPLRSSPGEDIPAPDSRSLISSLRSFIGPRRLREWQPVMPASGGSRVRNPRSHPVRELGGSWRGVHARGARGARVAADAMTDDLMLVLVTIVAALVAAWLLYTL